MIKMAEEVTDAAADFGAPKITPVIDLTGED